MTALGVQLNRTAGGYEEAVAASREAAHMEDWLDGNPDGPAADLFLDAYAAMAAEILEICPNPASIWVPSGNGTTAVGVARGLADGSGRPYGTTNTAVCVAGSAGNTAVTASVAAGEVVELDPHTLQHSEVNEPLLNWRSLHAAEALEAVRGTGGFANDATDSQLLDMRRLLRRLENIVATPAASSALVGLVNSCANARLDAQSPHVAILTA
jgi:threonine synthase